MNVGLLKNNALSWCGGPFPKPGSDSTTFLLIVVLLFPACSRQLSGTRSVDCKFRLTETAKMLAGKKWTETSIEARRQEGENTYKNVTGQFMPSDLDDVMYFNKNGTYIFDEGKTKARPQSAQVYENDRWCICKSGNKLVLGSGASATTYEIIKLEENLLVLQLLRSRDENAEAYLLTYRVAK